MTAFSTRLAERFQEGKRLSVGIDPHESLLAAWGLDYDADGLERFGREIISSVAQSNALCVKPQVAFFERFGSAGYKALERVFEDARAADILIIADVKRGDIGSTFEAYAEAWLGKGGSLEADAMTVHPYHGFNSLDAAYDLALKHDKGVFVLSATSNPEAKTIQRAEPHKDESVANHVLQSVRLYNEKNHPGKVASLGVVLGATLNLADYSIDKEKTFDTVTPILAPGFGAQGADVRLAAETFGALSEGLIVHESRSLLASGPKEMTQKINNHPASIGFLQ